MRLMFSTVAGPVEQVVLAAVPGEVDLEERPYGDQPEEQRQFAGRMGATTIEVSTNHVAMVSHPDEVMNLITTTAQAVPTATQIRRLRLNCSRRRHRALTHCRCGEHMEGPS
jgi:hypothetical protein